MTTEPMWMSIAAVETWTGNAVAISGCFGVIAHREKQYPNQKKELEDDKCYLSYSQGCLFVVQARKRREFEVSALRSCVVTGCWCQCCSPSLDRKETREYEFF